MPLPTRCDRLLPTRLLLVTRGRLDKLLRRLGAALKQRNRARRVRLRVPLREEKVRGGERDAERDDDAKVAPGVRVRVTVGEVEVARAVDLRLAGDGADRRADLVVEADVLVPGALRHEYGALRVERAELIRNDGFVGVAKGLQESSVK